MVILRVIGLFSEVGKGVSFIIIPIAITKEGSVAFERRLFPWTVMSTAAKVLTLAIAMLLLLVNPWVMIEQLITHLLHSHVGPNCGPHHQPLIF